MTERPTPISRLLANPSSGLSRLLLRLDVHQRLLRQVQESLPHSLSGHCLAVTLRDARLTVFADSSAWSTRLRYHIPIVQEKLAQDHGPSISEIKLRVLPRSQPPISTGHPAQRLSQQSAQVIRTTAANTDDPELRAALFRLAGHT